MAHLQLPPPVNMQRVTGRDEGAAWIEEPQRRAPWGYGRAFDPRQLPPTLRLLADRLQTCGDFHLGSLRDVTINLRSHAFYRLDPHVDPLSDGGNVFVLGFLSPTVLTLSPIGHHAGRMDQRKVARHSWAPGEDFDCLLEPRTLLHLSGDARNKLNHGIRLGVDAAELKALGVELPLRMPHAVQEEGSATGSNGSSGSSTRSSGSVGGGTVSHSSGSSRGVLYDWWGSAHSPVARAPERLSVVFAFAAPGEVFSNEAPDT
jgi:hypothetical protein